MTVKPVLVIRTVGNNTVSVSVRSYDDSVEHQIVLNSVLAYWWANNLSPVVEFLELFESVIKRTINEIMPHKDLNLKYEVKADDDLEDASSIEINILEVNADGYGFKVDGSQLVLKGLSKNDDTKDDGLVKTFEKKLITPDVVLKKYHELSG